jgi:hypothetical protein
MWMVWTLVDANGAMISFLCAARFPMLVLFLDLDQSEIGSNEVTNSKSLAADGKK